MEYLQPFAWLQAPDCTDTSGEVTFEVVEAGSALTTWVLDSVTTPTEGSGVGFQVCDSQDVQESVHT